jgi:hypothetical protein
MKMNRALRGLGSEIGSNIIDAECHVDSPSLGSTQRLLFEIVAKLRARLFSQQRRKPTRLIRSRVGFCASRSCLLRFAHPHTHTGPQQQQHIVKFVFGIIVIEDILYRCQLS